MKLPLPPSVIHKLRHTHRTLPALARFLGVGRSTLIRALKGTPLTPRIVEKLSIALPPTMMRTLPQCAYCGSLIQGAHNLGGTQYQCPETWSGRRAHIRGELRIRYLGAPINLYQIRAPEGWYLHRPISPYTTVPERPEAVDQVATNVNRARSSYPRPPTRSTLG